MIKVMNVGTSKRRIVPGGAFSALFAVIAACCLTAGTGGCGTSSPNGHHQASRSTTCHGLTRLTLRRSTVRSLVYFQTFSFPSVTRSEDVTATRSVARVLCSLPLLPKGIGLSCRGWYSSYSLTFYGSVGRLATVEFQAADCQDISGLGNETRIYGKNSVFWPVLGEAIGLTAATQRTFMGSNVKRRK